MPKKNGKLKAKKKTPDEIQELKDRIAEIDEKILFADGFEDALIGVVEGWFATGGPGAHHGHVALYDIDKCVEILMERDGMSYEDACEHISYNVTGGYVGEKTPVFATIMRKEYLPKKAPKKKAKL